MKTLNETLKEKEDHLFNGASEDQLKMIRDRMGFLAVKVIRFKKKGRTYRIGSYVDAMGNPVVMRSSKAYGQVIVIARKYIEVQPKGLTAHGPHKIRNPGSDDAGDGHYDGRRVRTVR